MSFQTFIISQINAINTTLNNLKVNAKRIFELPSQTTLDLSSKIHVSRGGVDEQLELQLLANALQSNSQNRIIGVDGNITVSGNNITVPPVQWSIDNIEYSTSTNTVLNSDYCEDGLNRKDIIVADNNGLLILVNGVESSGLVVRPNIPLNSLLVTEIDVSDSTLGTSTDPFIGISYIKKTDYQPYASNVSGDDAEIVLNVNGYSEIRLTNPLLNSIAGVDVAAALSGTEPPYNGKPFRVRNLTGNSITIKNDSVAVTNPFKLNANTDLVFPNNEIIHFIYDASGMIEDVKSFGASVDISGKLDKVETTAAQRRFYAVNTDGSQTVVNESAIAGGGATDIEIISDLINEDFDRASLGANYVVSGTASFSILSNKLRVTGTGSASSFANNCINISKTNCENFVAKATFQIISTRNLNDYGIGLMCQSVSSYFKYSFYMLLDLSTNVSSGKLNIFSSTSANGSTYSNIHVTSRAVSLNVNDIIQYEMSRNKNIYSFKATNLNTNETVSWFMESTVATGFDANRIVNNVVNFGFSKNATSASNYDILSLNVKRNTIKNSKFLFIGDSITFGYETDLVVNRWADLVFRNIDISGKHCVYAQPGNGCIDYANNLVELAEFTSEYAVVMLGMNEAQSSVLLATFQTNYTNLINGLVFQGKTPIICLITYSVTNNTNIVAYNSWLKSNYAGTYRIIDTYTATRDLGYSGIHPTLVGHKAIAQEVYNNILDLI